MKTVKIILIPLLTLLLCVTVLWEWTDGFKAFTVFSYTLAKAGEIPRELPEMELINQEGENFSLTENKKYLLLNFVYLNCPQVCHKINNRLEDIYNSELASFIPSQLELLTISFDTQNDNVERIKNYRNFFGENPIGWNFALPNAIDKDEFTEILENIGIWAQKTPNRSIINHSVYIFLISPENKIIHVFDPALDKDEEIIKTVSTCLEENKYFAIAD